MVSKSKLSNIKWTPIKVDFNCLFEDQMLLFYLKVNTNCINVFQCPKQSNDHDCGYYICRYMKEIFTYYEGGTIPIDVSYLNCMYYSFVVGF